jgi:hypothetical protein
MSLYISWEDEIEEDLKVTPGSRQLGSRPDREVLDTRTKNAHGTIVLHYLT